MRIIWVPRSEWGATQSTELFIANRVTDPADEKTEIHVHHTATVDGDDSTPNRWDYTEARRYMRSLQTARPDLGPLPYSENVAISEDLQTAWVFEGRGILTRGAHTGGHNAAGVGWGVFGNFDKYDRLAARVAVEAIEERASLYRDTLTPNLGDTKSPNGWDAWGHRDSSSKTCPGHSLYPLLADFTLEESMPTADEIAKAVWARTLGPSDADPDGTRISTLTALSRVYRGVNDLTVLDDGELAQIAVAVADEQARRLQG